MATRAMISIDGIPFVTTKWNGDLNNLGYRLKLLNNKMCSGDLLDKVFHVATCHTIEALSKEYSKEPQYMDIAHYDGVAIFQYDFSTTKNRWSFRRLGEDRWPNSANLPTTGVFVILTDVNIQLHYQLENGNDDEDDGDTEELESYSHEDDNVEEEIISVS